MESAPPRDLGNVVPLGDYDQIPEGSPPTSYAAYDALSGQPEAIFRLVGFTGLRALLIAPGVALAGVRGKQLIWGSLAASAGISLVALGYAAFTKSSANVTPVGPLPTETLSDQQTNPAGEEETQFVDTTADDSMAGFGAF